jgi:predicted RNase H-like HicB family nuclease
VEVAILLWTRATSSGCATQSESFEELLQNLYEAVAGCFQVEIEPPEDTGRQKVIEIVV